MAESGRIWRPNAKQIKLAELLLNFEDQRTKKEKFAAVGLPERTAYRWLKDKRYIDYINKQLDQYTNGELADVWRSLINKCKRGNVPAMRLFFELKGYLGNNW